MNTRVTPPQTPRRGLARVALAVAGLAMAVYAAILAGLWFGQERLLFRPVPLPDAKRLVREPDVQETSVAVPGARLSMLELRLPQPRGVVFYLHGNSGNLASWFVNTSLYRRSGFDLVMLDYRGYGKSTGHIDSEAQLHADVRAAWQQVAPRYAGRRVVLLGRSLGSGLAARLALEVQPDLTVLVSPYRSMVALAQLHYPWVPESVLRYRLRTDEVLAALRGQVLLVHGERDMLVPSGHSEVLRAQAPGSTLAIIAGAGHNDLQNFEAYARALTDALAALR